MSSDLHDLFRSDLERIPLPPSAEWARARVRRRSRTWTASIAVALVVLMVVGSIGAGQALRAVRDWVETQRVASGLVAGNDYVYLSDGGHFENLGIYEMVRRRCRYIISVDAGADPNYTFADLGNAVRKIAIDLGITIQFYGLTKLKKRPPPGDDDIGAEHPYSAIGVIDYPAADGGDSKPGMILYIKAGYHGVEDPGIRAYAIENPAFPHQGTIDQFFSESQFESYRALGFEITDGVLSHAAAALDTRGEERSLDKIFTELRAKVDDPRPATVNDGRGNSRGGD